MQLANFGIWWPNLNSIAITGEVDIVFTSEPGPPYQPGEIGYKVASRTPVMLAMADLSNTASDFTQMTITRGTWDGTTFTADPTNPEVTNIIAETGCCTQKLIQVQIKGMITHTPYLAEAIRVVTDTDSSTTPMAHIRVQGIMVQVSP